MIFKNALVFTDGRFTKTKIKVTNSVITEIGNDLAGDTEVNLSGKLLLPGFVDIHTHGCVKVDFASAGISDILCAADYYASHGVTSVLATLVSGTQDSMCAAAERINLAMSKTGVIKGINVEGPFFGKEKRGAHSESVLTPPDNIFFDRLISCSGETVRIVSVDPCLDGAMRFIEKYKKKMTVSLGHSPCDYYTALTAFNHGASHVTHLFNAMNPILSREPGLVGAWSDGTSSAELICDGVHVSAAVIRLVFAAHPERVVMISDSLSACGLPDGEYMLGDKSVTVRNSRAVLTHSPDIIAGSVNNLFDDVRFAINSGVKPEHAILSATCRPAHSAHLESIGEIKQGYFADLIVTDLDYNIEQVYLSGKKIL